MHRRRFLALASVAASAAAMSGFTRAASKGPVTQAAVDEMRSNWKVFLPKDGAIPLELTPVQKSAAEWKQALGEPAYYILRTEGTERPFSSPLNDEKRSGLFVCAGCSLPLFTSAMKFDSGTGWPSFFTSIPNHFATSQDHKLIMLRTEYHCARCGGHHGHVFDDGPAPTHERWCNNGLALRFLPSAGKAA